VCIARIVISFYTTLIARVTRRAPLTITNRRIPRRLRIKTIADPVVSLPMATTATLQVKAKVNVGIDLASGQSYAIRAGT